MATAKLRSLLANVSVFKMNIMRGMMLGLQRPVDAALVGLEDYILFRQARFARGMYIKNSIGARWLFGLSR